jgi:hypothetical protein
LALDASLWSSHSLPLAWVGSLGTQSARTPLGRAAMAFFCTAPLLLPLQGANPLSILATWALAPVFIFFLFPACVAAFAIPAVVPFSEALWRATLSLASELNATFFSGPPLIEKLPQTASTLGNGWRWAYVAAVSAWAVRRARGPHRSRAA